MRTAILTLLAAASAALSLDAGSGRQLTRPQLPSLEALQKVGLKMRWHLHVPIQDTRDGLAVAQCVDNQFVAQTYSGLLLAADAETGRIQWQARFDKPFGARKEYIAASPYTFFVVSNTWLYGVDRATGNLDGKASLPGVLATGPTADVDRLYICTSAGRVHAYAIPLSQAAQREGLVGSTGGYGSKTTDPSPPRLVSKAEPLWAFQLEASVLQPPALFGTHIVFADGKGTLFSFQRDQRAVSDVLKSPTPISAPMARQVDMLYVASEDHFLYAYHVELGRLGLQWRFPAGGRALQKPMAIGDDLYLAVERLGLYALDKQSGDVRWNQPRAARFLGATKRLIAALDSQGRLLVLDRQKGQVVGTVETREFALSVQNDVSNRIYLANHDGLVVCLQDSDPADEAPVYYQTPPKQEAPKRAAPAEAAPKKEDKAGEKMEKNEK